MGRVSLHPAQTIRQQNILYKHPSDFWACQLIKDPEIFHGNPKLGGGFKCLLFSPLTSGDDPILLIFLKWVETIN